MNNKISLALIIKNEEQYLEKCLSYHKPYFDEIVIVDGGSTDNSTEIALKYTDKITVRFFLDDFANQRNYCIEKCSNEWIMMIDADEILEESLLESLDHCIEMYGNYYDAFYIPRINTITDLDTKPWLIQKYSWQVNEQGWINYPDYQCRLFKSHCRFKNKVHEVIFNTDKFAVLSEVHILHEKNWERQIRQNDHYEVINGK